MPVEEIVTPEIKAMVGNRSRPSRAVDPVTSSEIRRWVIATMDDNPLWFDDDYANSTRFGAGCAPGPFPMRAVGHWKRMPGTHDPVRELGPDDDLRYGDESLEDAAVKIHWPEGVGAFHAGNDVTYYQLPRLGDEIFIVERIVDIEEKVGRSGKLAIVHFERTYTNQDGDVLLVNRQTQIAREMSGKRWKKGTR